MNRLNVTDARCEALFVSQLQQSEAPTAQVRPSPRPLARPLCRRSRAQAVAAPPAGPRHGH
jgi:hypothetical protein